ncbi:MAG: flagellar motor switch protein FliN [Pseudomonadota bacterium]
MSDMKEAPQLGGADLQAAVAANVVQGLDNEASNHYRFLADIPVRLSVEVGQVTMSLSEIMDLEEGAVVELGRPANELLDIKVNGALVAKGEIINVDGRFAIRVAEVVTQQSAGGKIERRAS